MTPQLYSIAVFVTDIDRAIDFYQNTLGLPLNRRGSFGGEFLENEPHLGVHPAVHPEAEPTRLKVVVSEIEDRLAARGQTEELLDPAAAGDRGVEQPELAEHALPGRLYQDAGADRGG